MSRDRRLQDILEGRERYERALAAAQLQSVQLLSGGGDDQVHTALPTTTTTVELDYTPSPPPSAMPSYYCNRGSIMMTATTLPRRCHARARLC